MDDSQQAANRGGRPVNPQSNRKVRTYREKLRAAGTDLRGICAANAWARAHGVQIDGAAELLERSAPAMDVSYRVEHGLPGPELHDHQAAEPELGHEQAAGPELGDHPEPELEDVVDPSVFPDLGGVAPDDEAEPKQEAPPADTFMGERPDLVAACAQAPAFVFGALARLTEGRAIDLTRPVKVTLFKGTPVERAVDADPVTRLAELTGVAMARRIEKAAAAAAEAGDAGGGKPGVAMELLPLGLAFGAAVIVPSADAAKGIGLAAVGWLLRGAQGAAAGVSRLFRGRR